MSLLNGPIEIDGDWGRMITTSVHAVVERMRRACLDGVRLLADDQPQRLRVTEHTSGPPSVWPHDDTTRIGWINVAVGEHRRGLFRRLAAQLHRARRVSSVVEGVAGRLRDQIGVGSNQDSLVDRSLAGLAWRRAL